MAASTRIIEEEHGTYRGTTRRHNGYWAGDLSSKVSATSGPTRPATYRRR